MPLLLHLHQPHFFFSSPISAVRSSTQPFLFPQSTASFHRATGPTVRRTVRCMANPRRVKMVAKQIQRELSDMLLTDKVLQYAVLPEAALGADRYLSSLTTISDVEVSNDLQVIAILDRIKAEKASTEGGNEEQSEPSDLPKDNQDWEGDDPDEDIIYVE